MSLRKIINYHNVACAWVDGWVDVQGEVVEAAARQNEHPDYSSSAEFSHHSLRIMEVLEEEEEEEEVENIDESAAAAGDEEEEEESSSSSSSS